MEFSVLTSLQLWTTTLWRELGSLPGDTSREKSCCIHEATELCRGNASRNSAQQSFPLPSYPVFENMESNSSWVLYWQQSVLRNPGEWTPSRKDCPARQLQLHSHSIDDTQSARALSVHSTVHFYHSLSKDWNWTFPEAMDYNKFQTKSKWWFSPPMEQAHTAFPQCPFCSMHSLALGSASYSQILYLAVRKPKSEIDRLLIKLHYKVKSNNKALWGCQRLRSATCKALESLKPI